MGPTPREVKVERFQRRLERAYLIFFAAVVIAAVIISLQYYSVHDAQTRGDKTLSVLRRQNEDQRVAIVANQCEQTRIILYTIGLSPGMRAARTQFLHNLTICEKQLVEARAQEP